jgi:hypothetical protein
MERFLLPLTFISQGIRRRLFWRETTQKMIMEKAHIE